MCESRSCPCTDAETQHSTVFTSTHKFSHFYPSDTLPYHTMKEWASGCLVLSCKPELNHYTSPGYFCANSNYESAPFLRSCYAHRTGFTSLIQSDREMSLQLQLYNSLVLKRKQSFLFKPDLTLTSPIHIFHYCFTSVKFKPTTELCNNYYARSANTDKTL